MDRLVQRNVLAMSGRAVEASGDVDVLLLDKTGTITLGNRQAAEFVAGRRGRASASSPRSPSSRRSPTRRRRAARSSCSPRSGSACASASSASTRRPSSRSRRTTRMSGVDLDGSRLRKGAADAVKRFVEEQGGTRSRTSSTRASDAIARAGRHAARRRPGQLGARRRPPQGHRQGRHDASGSTSSAGWASAR